LSTPIQDFIQILTAGKVDKEFSLEVFSRSEPHLSEERFHTLTTFFGRFSLAFEFKML
jgi:hypothetical protein